MFHSKFLIPNSILPAFLFSSFCLLPACSSSQINKKVGTTTALTAKELTLVNNPPKKILAEIDALLPLALEWYDKVEKSLYDKGRVLSKAERKQAISLGVRNPDEIRVVILKQFPEPNSQSTHNHFEGARAMGNIIMLKPKHKGNSVILCHELVHIAQKDRLGLKQFLTRLAIEREVLGYSKSLLENEAYAKQQTIEKK